MNAYNLIDPKEPTCILFHAIAESEAQVKVLAGESDIDISALTIELERSNIRPEYGKMYSPKIESVFH